MGLEAALAPVGTPCCRYLPDVLLVKYLPGGGFMEGGGAPPRRLWASHNEAENNEKIYTADTV